VLEETLETYDTRPIDPWVKISILIELFVILNLACIYVEEYVVSFGYVCPIVGVACRGLVWRELVIPILQ
jgi:hypothetical protein